MKVCHIISGDLWAGAEVMTYHLLKGLQEIQDIQIVVILFNKGKLEEEIRKFGVPVEIVDENRLNFVQMLWKIRKIFRKSLPDIIHSHRYKENMIAYIAGKYTDNFQYVSTQHGIPENYGFPTDIKHRILTKIDFYITSKYFRKIAVVSTDIKNILIRKYNFPETKIDMIHNGVKLISNYTKIKKNDLFTIGSSGRLFPVKDYTLMVEIAREVFLHTENIRFELAGDGPERKKIQHLLKKYGIENKFILHGEVDDISEFYMGLDLYINTSIHEGIPMSVLEAMAHGLPVVVPNVGGLREILSDGIHGYLINERDPKYFSEKCLYLYRNQEIRREMAIAAREKVEREFSLRKMAQKYYQLYRYCTEPPIYDIHEVTCLHR